ncbi:phospholipase/Carboxylesterase [Rhodopirellula maiorica SM1]|uniref:Phospholipase/Carboxylesterase n=1 Tax=Rhodopirellula maiorica SM1 TaxID=1265738 RepID=M5RIK1_9BACT|nr:alpha/beta hydrolase-fold protein [Rhodopirellula maiorica]EMI19130.1 phospholipase/Carboxylesterase [Rhodopirellula maiorica SM1]
MSRYFSSANWGTSRSNEAPHDDPPSEGSLGTPEEESSLNFAGNSESFLQDCTWHDSVSDVDNVDEFPSPFDQFKGVGARTAFFLPLHYEANYAYPLLIWLHNDGFNENQVTQVMPHISLRNYVGVGVRASCAIDSAGHRYEWRTRPGAIQTAYENVMQAIDEACERFSVNASRVVLAGYQSGGAMAMRIALRDPKRFAGVVSLGGRMPSGGRALSNLSELRERRMPMLWQWATESSMFDSCELDEDMRRAMMIRAQLEIRQYCDDDEMNTVALADVDQWIMDKVVASASNSGSSDRWASSPTRFSSN